jgi:non-ribosomal peptide synthase protein (TIGR01720 family)
LFHFARPLAASFGKENRHPYALDLNAMFFDSQLQVTWGYSTDAIAQSTVINLAQEMRKRLRALIEYCSSHQDTQLTPQDFPNAGIDQNELDDLMADYGDV